MKKLILTLALTLPLIACTNPDIPTLLQYAQWGIDADCKFGAGALAADVCTFGGDAISAANAAYAKDPANGVKAVKQILVDAETRQPTIAPYIDWLVTKL
jgi:hypothetical protein